MENAEQARAMYAKGASIGAVAKALGLTWYRSKKLKRGARAMLDVLVEHRGRPMSREALGAAVEMEPGSGTFSSYLSDLRQAGLIITGAQGVQANAETLLL